MKIAARVDTAAIRARAEAQRIAARLQAEVEREIQTSVDPGEPFDAEARREAVERAVRRIWGATL